MSVISKKLDLSSFKGLNTSKSWTITQLVGGEIIPYDLSSKTLVFKAYDRSNPINELYELSPVIHNAQGLLTFNFNAAQTDYDEPIDYLLIEDPLGTPITIGYGTITFIPINAYVPYSEIIANEIPAGVEIPDSYITLKTYEWRIFLQKAIDPHISDEDVQNETAWPMLVNVLIAKLVVYDFILKALKGLLGQSGTSGSGEDAGSGNVKAIETGPTKVEFFDSTTSIANFSRVDKNGNSALQSFAIDICQLARRVRIYLPMCKNPNTDPFIPLKAERPCNPKNPFDIINSIIN